MNNNNNIKNYTVNNIYLTFYLLNIAFIRIKQITKYLFCFFFMCDYIFKVKTRIYNSVKMNQIRLKIENTT